MRIKGYDTGLHWCQTFLTAFAPYHMCAHFDWKNIKESLFYACLTDASSSQAISTVRLAYKVEKRTDSNLCKDMYNMISTSATLGGGTPHSSPPTAVDYSSSDSDVDSGHSPGSSSGVDSGHSPGGSDLACTFVGYKLCKRRFFFAC